MRSNAETSCYLDERRIPEFLNFLMSHLAVERPDEPLGYLHELLDKCLLFRAGLIEPPLLFDARHIESLFTSLDPDNIGYITLDQYAVGMKTLGIANFDANPMKCNCTPSKVDRQTFEEQAKNCLIKVLCEMIATP
ncbi:PREDICTED: uncharacterized protein LOC105361331 [Ceratosolen solmsi marchali]|uniref:Uncharacterized protein LOC105361331 n=1 Tax=Ceratosolen solmsi marchali TaxID=326594 RepID=A0AAJ6YEV6_9HYME|nr:PREDICTED: uncharacterized protein LOC105361331 [Ceratosolen solmsi marchali]